MRKRPFDVCLGTLFQEGKEEGWVDFFLLLCGSQHPVYCTTSGGKREKKRAARKPSSLKEERRRGESGEKILFDLPGSSTQPTPYLLSSLFYGSEQHSERQKRRGRGGGKNLLFNGNSNFCKNLRVKCWSGRKRCGVKKN